MSTSRSIQHMLMAFGALLLALLAVCTVAAKLRRRA